MSAAGRLRYRNASAPTAAAPEIATAATCFASCTVTQDVTYVTVKSREFWKRGKVNVQRPLLRAREHLRGCQLLTRDVARISAVLRLCGQISKANGK